MFYNIKIKSGSAEFILESNNKQITQREMDIYFSRIFGASEEFKAQIKDVEIKSENVISIDYLDKQSDLFVSPEKKIVIQEPIIAKTFKNIEEIKNSQENSNQDNSTLNSAQNADLSTKDEEFNESIGLAEDEIKEPLKDSTDRIEQIKNAPLTSILIQNEPLYDNDLVFTRQRLLYEEMQKEKEKEKILTEEENQKRLNDIFSSDISEYDDDIESAVAQVKEDIAVIDNVKSECDFDNKTVQNIETAVEIVPEKTSEITEENIKENIVENAHEIIEENINENVVDNDVQNAIKNDDENIVENTAQNVEIKEKTDIENVEIIDLSTFEQTDSAINSFVGQSEEIVSIRPEEKSVNKNMDFKTYLEGFDTNSLVDDFLICAYYIKNVLGQDGFTMKEINSKIFQATGKIADMTIVQALTNKEYISFVQNEYLNKYFITPDGENYFRVNFEE